MKLVGGGLLREIPGRSGTPHRLLRLAVIANRQPDDDDRRNGLRHATRRLDPIHPGHVQIHHHDIGMQRGHESYGFKSVAGFSDNDNIVIRVQDAAQSLPHHCVIVHEQDPNDARFAL